jgi:hypothetical protein
MEASFAVVAFLLATVAADPRMDQIKKLHENVDHIVLFMQGAIFMFD